MIVLIYIPIHIKFCYMTAKKLPINWSIPEGCLGVLKTKSLLWERRRTCTDILFSK